MSLCHPGYCSLGQAPSQSLFLYMSLSVPVGPTSALAIVMTDAALPAVYQQCQPGWSKSIQLMN